MKRTALFLIIALLTACTHPAGPAAPVKRGLSLGTQHSAVALVAGSNDNVAIAPTGNTTTLLQFTVDASGSTLSGMDAATASNGDLFFIRNNSASGNLTITNADTASLAANRFLTPGAASLVIPPRGGCLVEYDGTLGWTVLSPHGSPIMTAGTINGALTVAGITSSASLTLSSTAHLKTSGASVPVLSSCGSTPDPAIVSGSTDVAGQFTTGGTDTDCVMTFATTFTTAPSCVITIEGSATHPTYTVSATAVTFTVNQAQKVYNYICIGR